MSFKTLSQIKKARLLQSLEQQPDVLPDSHRIEGSSSAAAADPFDDEYAAFQSALAADLACDVSKCIVQQLLNKDVQICSSP